jgi:hypothetical protein
MTKTWTTQYLEEPLLASGVAGTSNRWHLAAQCRPPVVLRTLQVVIGLCQVRSNHNRRGVKERRPLVGSAEGRCRLKRHGTEWRLEGSCACSESGWMDLGSGMKIVSWWSMVDVRSCWIWCDVSRIGVLQRLDGLQSTAWRSSSDGHTYQTVSRWLPYWGLVA